MNSVRRKCPLVFLVGIAFALAIGGCRQPKRVLTQQQKNLVSQHVYNELPQDADFIPVNANFDDKVLLLGYKINKTVVKPGDTFMIVYYWKSLKKISGDWKIFVHLDSARTRRTFDHYAIEGLYPTEKWEPGQVIEDVQTVSLDTRYPEGPAKLWVGFFDVQAWKHAQKNVRLPIKDPGLRHTDGRSRLMLTVIRVGEAAQDKNVFVHKAKSIKIDGKLDEPEWKQAFLDLGSFETTDGKKVQENEKVEAGFLWDDQNLYFGIKVADKDVRCGYSKDKRDLPLWKGKNDVVELFLDPGADGKDYVELQIAPTGAIFDAKFDRYRTPRDASAAAKALNMKINYQVVVDGTLNNSSSEDKGYTIEVAIPWTEIPGLQGPPKKDSVWNVNIYRLSNNGTWALTWAPVGNDFHELAGAGQIRFK